MKKITKTPLAGIVGIAATKTSLACPQARCNGPATLPAGTHEPDFALESTLDQTVRLSEFRGQMVVLVNNKGFRYGMASLQKTILIAEDSPDDVFLLCRAYSKTGLPYDLRFVRNGQEAIDYLEGNAPFDRQSHPLRWPSSWTTKCLCSRDLKFWLGLNCTRPFRTFRGSQQLHFGYRSQQGRRARRPQILRENPPPGRPNRYVSIHRCRLYNGF